VAPPPPLRDTLRGAAAGEVLSPLAGKVVSIDAAVGTPVVAGQTVITLEAMKMNTLITATATGTVAAVHVLPGDGVEEGQLLMSLA
jgi:biotin carboxyl carrier protein